jgi:hypothetical protein
MVRGSVDAWDAVAGLTFTVHSLDLFEKRSLSLVTTALFLGSKVL